MEFLDPKKKRSYNIRLAIGFVLTGALLILATTILAFMTAGYSINKNNGAVIQNGLIFLNSHPVSANIYINGKSMGTTSARITLPEGTYNISLTSAGYHDWNMTLDLQGGSVNQLVYPFLFPLNPAITTALALPSAPEIATMTPDQHWMLVSIPNQFGQFSQIDITNPKAPITQVTIPANIFSNQQGTLQVVEWSNDSQHLLLKHTWSGGSEYVMLDRINPANSFNVNQLFTNPITAIRMQDKVYNKLYLYDSTTQALSLADVSSKTVTPVLSGVVSYWPYSTDQILYTTSQGAPANQVLVKLWNKNISYNIRTLPLSSNYLLNIANYSGNFYVIAGSSAEHQVYVYMNPLNTLEIAGNNSLPVPYTLLQVNGVPESATFSTSAQYLALQSGSEFSVYDFQNQTHYHYDTGLKVSDTELSNWMDGNRLTLVSGGRLYVFDFDGTNMVNFTAADPGYLPAFNAAFDALYTVTSGPNSQWSVIRTSLIAN